MPAMPAEARRRHLRREDLAHTPDDGLRSEIADPGVRPSYGKPVRVVGEQPYGAVFPFAVTVVPADLVR